jgi:predicted DNA-binding antitoxin AbrB/MazE fold protein
MSQIIEVIYEQGVLRLTQPIDVDEGARMRVVLLPQSSEGVSQTPAQILARIAALPVAQSGTDFSNRDHDAVLYGREERA